MSFYKDPNKVLHVYSLGTRAAAFLFLDESAVCLLCTYEGSWKSSIRLSVPTRGWGRDSDDGLGRRTFTDENSVVLVPMFFLHTTHCQSALDLIVSATSVRHCVLRLVAEYLKVLGVKRRSASSANLVVLVGGAHGKKPRQPMVRNKSLVPT